MIYKTWTNKRQRESDRERVWSEQSLRGDDENLVV
jgi:hypothetical protein